MARDPRGLLLYAGTFTALKACGVADERFDLLLNQAIRGRMATVIERIPYRMLDLYHTLSAAGLPIDMEEFARVGRMTLLAHNPNTVTLNDSDGYAITHTVFYLTDFGSRSLHGLSPFQRHAAVELLETLGMLARIRQNADLAGEVAASLASVGAVGSGEVAQSLRYLASHQNPDGAISGPPDALREEALGDDPKYREWALSYHTTAVAALAALLVRTRQNEPNEGRVYGGVGSSNQGMIARALTLATGYLRTAQGSRSLEERLASYAMCSRALNGRKEELRAWAGELVGDVEARSDAVELWGSMGADVIWTLAHEFGSSGLTPPSLAEFLEEVHRFVESAEELPDGGLPAARALKSLRLLSDQASRRLTRKRLHPSAFDGETDVRRLAGRILVCSGGDPRLVARPLTAWLPAAEQMAEALTTAFREYDLPAAVTLIRALYVVGWGHTRVVSDAVELLLQQQGRDGSFGYPATDDVVASASMRFHWTLVAVLALTEAGKEDVFRQSAASARKSDVAEQVIMKPSNARSDGIEVPA